MAGKSYSNVPKATIPRPRLGSNPSRKVSVTPADHPKTRANTTGTGK